MLFAAYANLIEEPRLLLRFEDVYYAYRRQMLQVAKRVLQDQCAAEDAVHDAFLGIARNMATVAKLREDEVRYYALRAAQNAARNLLRDTRRELPLESVKV